MLELDVPNLSLGDESELALEEGVTPLVFQSWSWGIVNSGSVCFLKLSAIAECVEGCLGETAGRARSPWCCRLVLEGCLGLADCLEHPHGCKLGEALVEGILTILEAQVSGSVPASNFWGVPTIGQVFQGDISFPCQLSLDYPWYSLRD